MKLNKKLDNLIQDTPKYHGKTRCTYNPNRVINLSNANFTGEQLKTLSLGPQFDIEREPRHYINHLTVDTDNAIRQLDSNIQNAFRYLATKRIQQIKDSCRHNTVHKRIQYNIMQIRKILENNNLTIARADKSKSLVIINKTDMEQKIDNFILENNIKELKKDPTTTYQKQTQLLIKNAQA